MQLSLPFADAPIFDSTFSKATNSRATESDLSASEFWTNLQLEAIELKREAPKSILVSSASLLGPECGVRLRRRGGSIVMTLARSWSSHDDLWSTWDELETALEGRCDGWKDCLSLDWNHAAVRRVWFHHPGGPDFSHSLWRLWRGAGQRNGCFWHRGPTGLRLRIRTAHCESWPLATAENLSSSRAILGQICGAIAGSNAAFAANFDASRPLRADAPAPLWLQVASDPALALSWHRLAVEMELWPTASLHKIEARPKIPSHELRDWEKLPPSISTPSEIVFEALDNLKAA